MSKHRHHRVRPRYGRIGVASSSLMVTVLAVLGGVGALPSSAEPSGGAIRPAAQETRESPGSDGGADTETEAPEVADESMYPNASEREQAVPPELVLPEDSGEGRRVVFSEGRQRVWLVNARGKVLRTYLVSGSLHDNLDPGTYAVYSRSEQAWGIDDSGTMKYFVRFAHGDNAAIGFHDIPVDEGRKVQSVADLGTPQSHGCIRQRRSDAVALWDFAPLGTTVVVTA